MSNDSFVVYKMFADTIPAERLADFLKKHGIEFILENNSAMLEASFGGGGEIAKEFAILIKKADVGRVNELLAQEAEKEIDSVGEDYYLYDFTDDELREVVTKSDEWNVFDVLLSRKLLKDRDLEITSDQLQSFKEKRIKQLALPEQSSSAAILLGYVLAIVSGFLGVAIGWFLYSQKKTLPNGEKVYSFSESDRRHGHLMMLIGGGIVLIAFLIGMFPEFFYR